MATVAGEVIETALRLVGGDRATTHGDKVVNHQNIADMWNAYLGSDLNALLTPHDVAIMMVLLKVARTKEGAFNKDDYVDMAGYAGVACEIMIRQENESDEGDKK